MEEEGVDLSFSDSSGNFSNLVLLFGGTSYVP